MDLPTTFEEAISKGWTGNQFRGMWDGGDKTYIYLQHHDYPGGDYFVEAPRWLIETVRFARENEKNRLQYELRKLVGIER